MPRSYRPTHYNTASSYSEVFLRNLHKKWLIGGGGDMVNGLDGREMGVERRQ